MDRAHNVTLEQRTKEFSSSIDGNQNEKEEGLTGTCASFCYINLVLMLIFTCLMVMVEIKVVDPRSRLTHFINYTKGGAKGLVKHCIL